MPEKSLTRKEREREARKQEVLETALALFAEKGFHEVSMQEIAKASEYSVGTLYNLFENKEALFQELMERTKRAILADMAESLASSGDPVHNIRAFIRAMPSLLEKFAAFVKVHVTVLGKKGSKVSRLEDDNVRAIMDTEVADIVSSGIAQGVFRKVDPLITAQALSGVLETVCLEMAGQFDMDVATDKFVKIEHLFVDGLLAVGGV